MTVFWNQKQRDLELSSQANLIVPNVPTAYVHVSTRFHLTTLNQLLLRSKDISS